MLTFCSLAVSKLVVSMARSTVRSPYAHCLLIRLACRVMGDNEQMYDIHPPPHPAVLGIADKNHSDRTLLDYLESCLRHKSDMVELEAARAMSNLPNITSKELASAVSGASEFHC
jgi:coatomer protein complex subunit gamma